MQDDDFNDEPAQERPNGNFYLDQAPATRAVLEAHPVMWPRIFSDVPTGWDAEVAQALRVLVQLSADTGVSILVAQIKSKFAGLRIHLDIDEVSIGRFEEEVSTPMNARLRASAQLDSVRQRARAVVSAAVARCATRFERCGEGPGCPAEQKGLAEHCLQRARGRRRRSRRFVEMNSIRNKLQGLRDDNGRRPDRPWCHRKLLPERAICPVQC
jgi:hypothetical protein